MNDKINQLFMLLFLLILAVTACRLGDLGQRQNAPPTPAEPPAAPTLAEPTPTNPQAVPPTDVPEPVPTDTPVPEPAPTDTPVPVPTDTPVPVPTDTPVPEPTPTSEPPPTEPPPPPEPAEEDQGTKINWGAAAGKPGFGAGQDVGYFIWTEGNRVRIRVVTRGGTRAFSGRVIGNGAILKVDRIAQEKIDVTLREDINQMDFSWVAAGGPDGLDFTFTGTILSLSLRIDNKPAPAFVFVGANKRTLDNGLPLQLVK